MASDLLHVRLVALIEPVVTGLGYALVRVRFGGGARRQTLQVMAERADGSLNVDDCAHISRALSLVLDEQDPIEAEYDLEVSSPGIDRPLTRPEDFDRWAGFEAKMQVEPAINGRKRFAGTLVGLADAAVVLRTGEGDVALPLTQVRDAKLVLTDALIDATLKQQKAGSGQQSASTGIV